MTALLLPDEAPRLLQPTLAGIFGVDGALFLQQIHYLRQVSKHEHAGQRWVYNTHQGWQRYFPFWGVGKIGHLIRELVQTGVLLAEQRDRNPLNRTNWYSLDDTRLAALVAAHRAGEGIAPVVVEGVAAAPVPVPCADAPLTSSRESARWITPFGALQDSEPARSKQRNVDQRIPNKEKEEVVEDSVPIPARVYPPPPPPIVRMAATTGTAPVPVAATSAVPTPLPPPEPPAPVSERSYEAETPPDPALPLIDAAWSAYRQDLDGQAPPGLRGCIARDIRAALNRGIALTRTGLAYAVQEATKARGPRWPYLYRIWQAHPAGPPATVPGGNPYGSPATARTDPAAARAAREAARAADAAHARTLLTQLLGGPLPATAGPAGSVPRAPALSPL